MKCTPSCHLENMNKNRVNTEIVKQILSPKGYSDNPSYILPSMLHASKHYPTNLPKEKIYANNFPQDIAGWNRPQASQ